MFVIGLDVGTSGVKSTLFDEKATVVGHAYREYDLICEGDGMFELDPTLLLRNALEVLAESTASCNRHEIGAICVTSFGESFVCMDKDNRVLSNTMIYMDKRGAQECNEFLDMLGEKEIFGKCGQFIDPMFAVYKLRWLQKHKPEMMAHVKRISFICDFITYMLGAEHCCDYSLAARSGMFEVKTKQWWDTAIEFAGIDKDILPKAVPGGSVVGTMSPATAESLGMTTSVKLIVGGHDQILAALGSGAKESGDIANGMGTVDCITAVMDGDCLDMDMLLKYNLPLVPFLEGNRYVTYAFNMSGGCTVKWFRDTLAKDIAHLPDAYRILDEEMPPDPTQLFVIPYFAGGGTPYMDSVLPAVIAGMRLNTSRGDVYRGFLEGETYEMKLSLDCLREAGIDVKKIITVGGGSKSPLWMQIRADIFERDVYIPKNSEAGTLASAILCYKSLGLYSSIEEAQADMIRYVSSFTPQEKNIPVYQKNYSKYKAIYAAMKGIYL